MSSYKVPAFLAELLHARSPSGYEGEAQAVFDRHVKPAADTYANDALGNRIATLNPKGDPVLMLAGRQDRIGGYVDQFEALRRYPNGTYAVVDGAGHYLPFERADVFAGLLRSWLVRA